MTVMMARLHDLPRHHFIDLAGPSSAQIEQLHAEHRWQWGVDYRELVELRDLQLQPDSTLFIFNHVLFKPGGVVVSDVGAMAFDTFIDSLPPVAVAPPKKRKAAAPGAVPPPSARHQWLSRLPEDDSEPPADGPASHSDGDRDDQELDDDWMAAAFEEVERVRLELEADMPYEPTDDFHCFVRWCRRNILETGEGADSYRAEAWSEPAKRWARLYRIPRSCTATFSVYGHHNARQLCLFWAHRMAFFFGLWDGSARFRYTQDQLGSYQEPEWVQAGFGDEAPEAVHTRANAIRRRSPRIHLGGAG